MMTVSNSVLPCSVLRQSASIQVGNNTLETLQHSLDSGVNKQCWCRKPVPSKQQFDIYRNTVQTLFRLGRATFSLLKHLGCFKRASWDSWFYFNHRRQGHSVRYQSSSWVMCLYNFVRIEIPGKRNNISRSVAFSGYVDESRNASVCWYKLRQSVCFATARLSAGFICGSDVLRKTSEECGAELSMLRSCVQLCCESMLLL